MEDLRTSSPSEEEINKLHQEALTINDEVDKRKGIESNQERTQSELAAISITERDHYIRDNKLVTPEFADKIKQTYTREVIASGVAVYIDPSLKREENKSLDRFLEYLETGRYEKDIDKVNELIPPQYIKADKADLPPVFIHTEDFSEGKDSRSKSIGMVAGGHNAGRGIHLINHDKYIEDVFIHELVHNLEGFRTVGIRDFQEGVTRFVELSIGYPKLDFHKEFLILFKEFVHQKSDHPLSKIMIAENKFNISIPELIQRRQITEKVSDNFVEAERIRDYTFMTSLFKWYKDTIDPSVDFLSVSGSHYEKIWQTLWKFYPDQRERGPDGKINYFGKKTVIMPEELQGITDMTSRFAVPKNDASVLKLLEDIDHYDTNPNQEAEEQLKIKLFEFTEYQKKRLAEIGEEYGQFLSDKLKSL